MPYVSFCIALYAQWLEQFSKMFVPAQSFVWVTDPVEHSDNIKPDNEARS